MIHVASEGSPRRTCGPLRSNCASHSSRRPHDSGASAAGTRRVRLRHAPHREVAAAVARPRRRAELVRRALVPVHWVRNVLHGGAICALVAQRNRPSGARRWRWPRLGDDEPALAAQAQTSCRSHCVIVPALSTVKYARHVGHDGAAGAVTAGGCPSARYWIVERRAAAREARRRREIVQANGAGEAGLWGLHRWPASPRAVFRSRPARVSSRGDRRLARPGFHPPSHLRWPRPAGASRSAP